MLIMSKKLHFYLMFMFTPTMVGICGCEAAIDEYIDSKLYAPKKLLCRSWVKTAELHQPANIITNVFNSYMPCAKDNEYKYDSDGYYELNQGASSCYSTQSFVAENGRWEFQQNQTQLKTTLFSNGRVRIYTIVTLDSNYHLVTTYIDSSTPTKVTVKEEFSPR
jgi:hypothetical protein